MHKIITFYYEDHDLINTMYDGASYVWTDHFMYTRNAIISALASLGDLPDVMARLMKNQEDIGATMIPFYKTEDIDSYVALLKGHIDIAGELVTAVKASQPTDEIMARWSANGDDIVNLMAGMNPVYWDATALGDIWKEHLRLTALEMTTRFASDWTGDIAAADAGHKCMMEFSDAFSEGIVFHHMEMFSKK